MTSWNGHIFCVTGPMWEESTCHWWIPSQRPVTELWCFRWSAPANDRDAGELRRHGAHYDVTLPVNRMAVAQQTSCYCRIQWGPSSPTRVCVIGSKVFKTAYAVTNLGIGQQLVIQSWLLIIWDDKKRSLDERHWSLSHCNLYFVIRQLVYHITYDNNNKPFVLWIE